MDTYTVAVRVPVAFESAAEMAGWVERAIVSEMERKGWTGGAYVLWRDEQGVLHGFLDGEGGSTPPDPGDVLSSTQRLAPGAPAAEEE